MKNLIITLTLLSLFSCNGSKDKQIDNLYAELYFRSTEADFQHYRANFYQRLPTNDSCSIVMEYAREKLKALDSVYKNRPELFTTQSDTFFDDTKKDMLLDARLWFQQMDTLMERINQTQ